MSRTVHPNAQHASVHRRFKNMNYRRAELNAVDAMDEVGINPSNRLKSWMSRIPNVWDDYMVSAAREFTVKNMWRQWRDRKSQPHFTMKASMG